MKNQIKILTTLLLTVILFAISCSKDNAQIEVVDNNSQIEFVYKYQDKIIINNVDKNMQLQLEIKYDDEKTFNLMKNIEIEYVYKKCVFLEENYSSNEIEDVINETEKPDAIIEASNIIIPENAVGYIIKQNNTDKASWETYIWWRTNGVFGSKVKRTGNKKVYVKMYEDDNKVLYTKLKYNGESVGYINLSNGYSRFLTKVKSRSSYDVYFARCTAEGNCYWIKN